MLVYNLIIIMRYLKSGKYVSLLCIICLIEFGKVPRFGWWRSDRPGFLFGHGLGISPFRGAENEPACLYAVDDAGSGLTAGREASMERPVVIVWQRARPATGQRYGGNSR